MEKRTKTEPRSVEEKSLGLGTIATRRHDGPARNGVAKRLWFWAPFAWAAVIFAASHSPKGGELPMLIPHLDKVLHAGVYAVLSGLIAIALAVHTRLPASRIAWMALGLASLYGITDEIHQAFVPGRTTELADWIADTVGASWILVMLHPGVQSALARVIPERAAAGPRDIAAPG